MVIKRITISKWYFISMLITFRYLMPYYLDNVLESYPLLKNIIAVIPLIVGFLVVIEGKFIIKKALLPFVALYAMYIVSTIINI